MLLPDQTYESAPPAYPASPAAHPAAVLAEPALRAVLRAHRARPDFFCADRLVPPPSSRTRRCSTEASREGRRPRRRDLGDDRRREARFRDASSSNEAVHLQRRLLSLSSELVTLRNHLHVARETPALPPRVAPPALPAPPPPPPPEHPVTSAAAAAAAADTHKELHHAEQQQQPRWRAAEPPPAPAAPAPAPAAPAAPAAPDVEDLVHLRGPLSEEAVVRVLQNRFYHNKFYTWIGPILVAVNGFSENKSSLTLGAATAARGELARLVQDAVRHQADSGYPQAIILSGVSGAGKTHASMALLRRLFEVAGGGTETDAFKHLAAAFTVLRSLGAAHTARNRSSSRVGHFIELQVTDGALYRTKIHCYFLEPTRVVRPLPGERNYHIFYQMLAGLSAEERARLRLDTCAAHELRYLASPHARRPDPDDAARFQAWRSCLGVLGIPFLDVVRVLAAVLLLGNVQFAEGPDGEAELAGAGEAEPAAAAASLLGVSPAALLRGLAARRANSGPRTVRAVGTPAAASAARDALAKALYCRTVATIVRRANSLKRLGSTLGTLSSDSNESMHGGGGGGGGGDTASRRSAAGRGSRAAGPMAALNDAVRHATDGFVGILDMFGFEAAAPSRLEHLCANLCAETMQHFYNTHVFKSAAESCREEGVQAPVVEYADNVPCIDLVSSLRGGLLAALDAECAAGAAGSPERYAARVRQLPHARLLEPRPPHPRRFAVRHYAGDVTYDTSDFLEANRDAVPADLVAAFDRRTCDFGFATHLFGAELKVLSAGGAVAGGCFRAAPSSAGLGAEHSSLTQDFHTRLDNLLRTLVHARPHFVRCLRANDAEAPLVFERATVAKQVRSLQVLETVTLMATGYPHRMRFRAFVARYRAVVLGKCGAAAGGAGAGEEGDACAAVLRAAEPAPPPASPAAVRWAIGKRHVFLSEGMRQVLERVRRSRRAAAAACIQRAWRRHRALSPPPPRAAAPRARSALPPDPRPPPPAPAPPAAEPPDKCDPALVRHTCSLFGLDLERPPPLPPSRAYSVWGGVKLGYPQTRLVTADWAEPAGGGGAGAGGTPRVRLRRGDAVTVVSAARPGYLAVQIGTRTVAVPHRVLAPPRAPPPPRSQPPPPAPPAAPPAARARLNHC